MSSEPIRILHCVVNMNRGGVETLLMNLYRNIDREKIQFDFLTSNEGVFDEEIKSMGGKIYRIPYLTKTGISKYTKALRQFFSQHREFQIVHAHMDKVSGIVLREAKREGIAIRIAHSHSTRSEGAILKRIIKGYCGLYIDSKANRYFACGNNAANFLFSKKKHVGIINNGIEVSNFKFSNSIRHKMRNELGIEDKFVIGHVGRFSEPKNHQFLIDIFVEIYKLNPNARLLLIGTGGLEESIRNKVDKLGIANAVYFLGSRGDVNQVLQAFDIMVFPSLYEGLPVTLIEAQASGLKCVISDNITTEVDMTGNIEYISLDKEADYWAKMILKYNYEYERESEYKKIIEKKYDIKQISKWLEGWYINEYKNINQGYN